MLMTVYLKTMYTVIFTINISKQLTQLITDPKPLRDDLKQPVLKEGLCAAQAGWTETANPVLAFWVLGSQV